MRIETRKSEATETEEEEQDDGSVDEEEHDDGSDDEEEVKQGKNRAPSSSAAMKECDVCHQLFAANIVEARHQMHAPAPFPCGPCNSGFYSLHGYKSHCKTKLHRANASSTATAPEAKRVCLTGSSASTMLHTPLQAALLQVEKLRMTASEARHELEAAEQAVDKADAKYTAAVENLFRIQRDAHSCECPGCVKRFIARPCGHESCAAASAVVEASKRCLTCGEPVNELSKRL